MKVKFYTLGCKVNQYETKALMEDLAGYGFTLTQGKADLYVINTCTVTAKADAKSRGMIRRAKKENPSAKIAVSGCLAQLNREYIKKTGADYIIPQDSKHQLADIVAADFGLNVSQKESDRWSMSINGFFNQRAFIKVQDGCDNFCSFCKVPHVRGRSISRPAHAAIAEIERLTRQHKEIVLTGINLALYGKDLQPRVSLAGLVQSVLGLKDLGRLRLSSLEPAMINAELVRLFSQPKLCPHVHLPFQSGDDAILAAMNKKATGALYLDAVSRFRQAVPQIAVSCDVMVGFPGEDESAFRNTIAFLKKVRPMRVHIFTFSGREGTRYQGWQPKDPRTAAQRSQALKRLCTDFSRQYERDSCGKTLTMVTEEFVNGWTSGYTENYLRVSVNRRLPLGELIPVRLIGTKDRKLAAEV